MVADRVSVSEECSCAAIAVLPADEPPPMRTRTSSVLALVRLLEVFALDSDRAVRQRTMESAAEAFDAAIVGIVCNGSVIASIGLKGDTTGLVAAAQTGAGTRTLEYDVAGCRQLMCLPIEGKPGTFFVLLRENVPFGGEDAVIARAMVRLMRLAVRTISAFEEEQRLAAELHARHTSLMQRLMAIQSLVSTAGATTETLQAILDQAGTLFGTDLVAIRRTDGGRGGAEWDAFADASLAKKAIDSGSLVDEPRIDGFPEVNGGLAAPLYCRGVLAGAMTVLGGPERSTPHDDEDREALMILAGYVSVALTDAANTGELQQSLAEAEWRAGHDHLTGLPNRVRIVELIDEEIAAGRRPIALYLDFDGFKAINDLYGHAVGDAALVEMARRVVSVIRTEEAVARLAGDEFVALLPELPEEQALGVARRVASVLNAPLEVDGHQLLLPASIGIATIRAVDAEELLDAADLAMYVAKGSPGERIAFFDEELRAARGRRVQVEQALRLAIVEMSEFELHYQPIVGHPHRRIAGVEALIRWQPGGMDKVSPEEFITIAEEAGIVAHIDRWVLERAVADVARLPRSDIRVSVNLSPASFLMPDLPSVVGEILSRYGVAPHLLALEITERVMLGDERIVKANIEALHDLGAAVVLDDFGTGYSSLSYLPELNIRGLKIDRSFVVGAQTDWRGHRVLAAVIRLARELGVETVAEGVETEQQFEMVSELGCTRFQGHLFGRPQPLAALFPERELSAP